MSTSNRFLSLLNSDSVLSFDGAMGTQLFARGLRPGSCGELWNVDRPADVRSIHKAYVDAGSTLITTNTFGGTRVALGRRGIADRVNEINAAGVKCARNASATAIVVGDIGPLGELLEPLGDVTEETARHAFEEQARALADAGADVLLVETMEDVNEASIAIESARKTGLPVISTFSFARTPAGEFRTMMGVTIEQAVGTAIDAGAGVVGTNCGTNLSTSDYIDLARELVAASRLPVIVQPNAGTPKNVDGKTIYNATPAEMAQCALALRDAGAKVIGGCCGTSPTILEAMNRALRG